MFLIEKGLEVGANSPAMAVAAGGASTLELVEIDLRGGEHFGADFLRRNPDGVLPCLELDDGRCISESLAICRYFEAIYPEPPLFGRDPAEAGLVEMWTRRIEQQLYLPTQEFYRNGHPAFTDRGWPGARGPGSDYAVAQVDGLVERSGGIFARTLVKLEAQLLRTRAFVVGDGFSMADIMLRTTLDFAQRVKVPAAQDLGAHAGLSEWYAKISARASAGA